MSSVFYLYEDLFDDLHASLRLRPVYQWHAISDGLLPFQIMCFLFSGIYRVIVLPPK